MDAQEKFSFSEFILLYLHFVLRLISMSTAAVQITGGSYW